MDDFDMPRDNTQTIKFLIAVGFLSGFFVMGMLPAFTGKAVDPGVLQTTQTIMTLIAGFFFGSSSGSAAKDKTIADQAAAGK